MIELVLVFTETGILIFKKRFGNLDRNENEEAELISGFFSVVFQYFSSQFGLIQSIKTENNLILIKKIDKIYLSLVIAMLKDPPDSKIEKVWFLNNRIEELAQETLRKMEFKIKPFFRDQNIPVEDVGFNFSMINKLQLVIDNLILEDIRKMEILKEMIGPTSKSERSQNKFVQIYENI